MKLSRYLVVLFLVMDACIEPFNAKIPDGERPLVVDGLITDQPGPYQVLLYHSEALNSAYGEVEWEAGATVKLLDDEGNSELLKETSAGHYYTSSTHGVVGKTYHLEIQIEGGSQYESLPEKLLPVGDFSNLRYTFDQELDYLNEDQSAPKNGFDIYLDATLDPAQNGLTRWRWTGTYEIHTYPELRLSPVVPGGPVPKFVPDPPKCSGYIVQKGVAVQQDSCVCCFCWVNQFNDSPLLSDKNFVANNQLTQVKIARIPANRNLFYQKYYLDVEQLSVSQNVYDFWESVSKQKNQGSDLFQTPPPATKGNIVSLTEGSPRAIGLFSASSVVKHSFIIYPADIPYRVDAMDTVKESCALFYRYSSTIKPSFW